MPLAVLFDAQQKANLYLFDQIPSGAIVEIVRPNWDLTQRIGTHLNVSHMGFVFRRNGQLLFRDASGLKQSVAETPLMDYLRQYLSSPTVKGINVHVVLEPQQEGVC